MSQSSSPGDRFPVDRGRPPRTARDLLPEFYDELLRAARQMMRSEGPGHTLEPGAVVNEAYLRLAGLHKTDWKGRSHFMAMATTTLRRVLVDHARTKRRAKRGGRHRRVSLQSRFPDSALGDPVDVLDLEDALRRLESNYPRQARVVELRFLGGLSVREAADELGVTSDVVKEDWYFARAWINRALTVSEDGIGEAGTA